MTLPNRAPEPPRGQGYVTGSELLFDQEVPMAPRPDIPRRTHARGTRRSDPWPAEEHIDAPAGRGWRDDVMGPAGRNVLAGIWLIISPWVIGYEPGDARCRPTPPRRSGTSGSSA
jgi:hypothetical protein